MLAARSIIKDDFNWDNLERNPTTVIETREWWNDPSRAIDFQKITEGIERMRKRIHDVFRSKAQNDLSTIMKSGILVYLFFKTIV